MQIIVGYKSQIEYSELDQSVMFQFYPDSKHYFNAIYRQMCDEAIHKIIFYIPQSEGISAERLRLALAAKSFGIKVIIKIFSPEERTKKGKHLITKWSEFK